MPPSDKAEAAHERSEEKGEGGWGEKSEGAAPFVGERVPQEATRSAAA